MNNPKNPERVRLLYCPTNYSDATKSSITEGNILVHFRFNGATSGQIDTLVHKALNLEAAALFRKISGTSKWYKRTEADRVLWETVLRERSFTFDVGARVGKTFLQTLTPEQAIAATLASGKSPEEVMAMVMAIAKNLQQGNDPSAEDAALAELAEEQEEDERTA